MLYLIGNIAKIKACGFKALAFGAVRSDGSFGLIKTFTQNGTLVGILFSDCHLQLRKYTDKRTF